MLSVLKPRKLSTAATSVMFVVALFPLYLIYYPGKLALLAYPLHDKGMVPFQFLQIDRIKPFQPCKLALGLVAT
jgi:hypothetical protein